jgi:hypothetical protein
VFAVAKRLFYVLDPLVGVRNSVRHSDSPEPPERWPSIRPDDVINILDFPSTGNVVPVDTFIKDIAPTKRIKWSRGLRENPGRKFTSELNHFPLF